MKIIKEIAAPEYGEHDFFLESEDAALFAARALTDEGYMVGGGNDPCRSTINIESGGAGQKTCIIAARKIIEGLRAGRTGKAASLRHVDGAASTTRT